MSNLLEFGSYGDLIATAICDFELSGKAYKKDDIILSLRDVPITLNYADKTVNSSAKRNLVYYNENFLDSLVVGVAPLDIATQTVFATIFTNSIDIIEKDIAVCVGGVIMPFSRVGELITIIDEEGTPLTDYALEENRNVQFITSENLVEGKEYNIFYKKNISAYNMTLDSANLDIPYVKLQVKFNGNLDKQTNDNYIIVDKAAIHLTPVIGLTNDSVSHIRILFKVIEGDTKPILSVVKDE